jgi:hypothetical protein
VLWPVSQESGLSRHRPWRSAVLVAIKGPESKRRFEKNGRYSLLDSGSPGNERLRQRINPLMLARRLRHFATISFTGSRCASLRLAALHFVLFPRQCVVPVPGP